MDQLQVIFSRSPPESEPQDSQVIDKFVLSNDILERDTVISLRKDILNQLYRMVAIKDITASYLLNLLKALKKLAKHNDFGEGVNMKVYFDTAANIMRWCCSDRTEETTVCLVTLLSTLDSTIDAIAYSLDKFANKGIAEALTPAFFRAVQETIKVPEQDPSTAIYVIDLLYWLLAASKDQSQLDYYNLKSEICSQSLAVFVLGQLRPGHAPELIMKTCKIIELMTDIKDFFFYLVKHKGLEDLADMISANISLEISVQIYTYFLKGLKLGIFTDKLLLRRLKGLALRDLQ